MYLCMISFELQVIKIYILPLTIAVFINIILCNWLLKISKKQQYSAHLKSKFINEWKTKKEKLEKTNK